MAISDAAIERLEHDLARSVEEFIVDGLSDWAQAAEGAVNDARHPDEEESAIFWLLSLAGNMLWASTVFFPAGAVIEGVATVSRATKAASILGAALGSNVAGKVREFTREPNPQNAKAYLRDVVAARKDELRELYVENADEWIKDELVSHVIATLSIAKGRATTPSSTWEQRHVTDEDLQTVTVHSQAELRDFSIEHFLFPGAPFSARELNQGLRRLMVRELQGALLDFDRQYFDWKADRDQYTLDHQYDDPPADIEDVLPFNPRLTFAGVPAPTRRGFWAVVLRNQRWYKHINVRMLEVTGLRSH